MAKEKKKRDAPDADPQHPCPVCGGVYFTWGQLVSQRDVAFRPNEGGIFSGFGNNDVKVWARKCDRCRNILLFT